MKRRRKNTLISLTILVLLIGMSAWATHRDHRQQRLDAALIEAVYDENVDSVKTLLAQGANPNAREMSEASHSLWQMLHRLLDEVRGHKFASQTGNPVVYLACSGSALTEHQRLYSPANIDAEIKALVEYGADVRTPTVQNEEVLVWVAGDGQASTLKFLLQHGADPTRNAAALINAIGSGDVKKVDLLLASGAKVNAKAYGGTPLHFAEARSISASNYNTIIALLKQAGAK